jgi:hypothetical protein
MRGLTLIAVPNLRARQHCKRRSASACQHHADAVSTSRIQVPQEIAERTWVALFRFTALGCKPGWTVLETEVRLFTVITMLARCRRTWRSQQPRWRE